MKKDHPNYIFKDTPHLQYTKEELAEIYKQEKNDKLVRGCQTSIGFIIYEAWEQGKIKFDTDKETEKELNDLLNDIKEIKEYK